MTIMTTPPKDQTPEALRTHFEALASDPSFKLSRSRRGTYVNPAVARDWKWFQRGASHAQQPEPAAPSAAAADPCPGCIPGGYCRTPKCGRLAALNAAPRANSAPVAAAPFQERVQPWLLECFGAEIAADRVERNHRFLEESLELVQSLGCTASEAHQLVDYVFGRTVGDPPQEVGGVMVTLAALCLASGLDMHDAGEVELARISAPELVAKIRAKQAAKPKHSPLPESAAPQADSQPAPPTEYPALPEPSATGLGDEYEAYDRNGRAMGKAYETIPYFKADQMRAYVDADRAARGGSTP